VHVTSWQDVHEAFRSPKLLQEPPTVEQMLGGATSFVDGPAHVLRRRTQNALVRREPLAGYKRAAEPALRETMVELVRRHPDGSFGCDLVDLLHKTFVRLAAAVIGLDGADTPAGRDDLSSVFKPLPLAHNVKYLTSGKEEVIAAALEAKRQYTQRFFFPSYERARRDRDAVLARGEKPGPPRNQLELILEGGDPAWNDIEAAIRETLSLLIGSIDTSTQMLVNLVLELDAWFAAHPADLELRTDPDFLYRATRESIRVHASTALLGRVASDDVELASGIKIKAGQRVAIYHSLANRDRSVLGPDEDRFNPGGKLRPACRPTARRSAAGRTCASGSASSSVPTERRPPTCR
jgi:cytochrome P450